MSKFVTRMYPKEGVAITSISIGGMEAKLEDGYIDVPSSQVEELKSHGLTTVPPAPKPIPLKAVAEEAKPKTVSKPKAKPKGKGEAIEHTSVEKPKLRFHRRAA